MLEAGVAYQSNKSNWEKVPWELVAEVEKMLITKSTSRQATDAMRTPRSLGRWTAEGNASLHAASRKEAGLFEMQVLSTSLSDSLQP